MRNRKHLKWVALLVLSLLTALSFFVTAGGTGWTDWDLQVLDLLYRQAVKHGHGPPLSPRILYVTITDQSYAHFGKNTLDRRDLARLNDALAELNVRAAAYDIIFARPSRPEADRSFAESIGRLGCAYLPIALDYTPEARPFRWKEGLAYERLRSDYLRKPVERGEARPFHATRALMQSDDFAERAFGSGHISAYSDPDGVYRHLITLIKVDDGYLPTLSLAMFLDSVHVRLDELVVEWGRRIVVPATEGSLLKEEVVIPIDQRGRTFVPFARVWKEGFEKVEVHALLQFFEDEDLRGNLLDLFEDSYVFIGDISTGTSDLGQTPLETNIPLSILHTSMLNGLLTRTFYDKWRPRQVLGLLWGLGLLLGLSALPRSDAVLYAAGTASVLGLIGFSWFECIHFRLAPVVTLTGGALLVFFGIVMVLQIAVSRERAFIRNAFSKYIPEKVVNQLLAQPDRLRLGGEERVATVLFSDLANFTTFSEKMSPADLVRLINAYLTEMTDLVIQENGIIDKYEGDAIMAEFGVPLDLPDHADAAVRCALRMQERLEGLREAWTRKGLPEIRCRIGINTGPMIVGNMGSLQVFDYTVMGDAVNLAARLEAANKRYGTFLMISEATRLRLTPGLFRTRILDVIRVKGKTEAVTVHEVYAATARGQDSADEAYYRTYQQAFEAYLARDFPLARIQFEKALSLRPGDTASRQILARMDGLDPAALPGDWDGSISLTEK